MKVAELMSRRLTDLEDQLSTASDPAERAALQESITFILKESLPKLSPRARALTQIIAQLFHPIIKIGGTYMQMHADFWGAPPNAFRNITTKSDVNTRITQLDSLHQTNQRLLGQLTKFEAETERLLNESKVTADDRKAFISVVVNDFNRQFSFMIMVRNLDTKIFAQIKLGLDFLEQHWGDWQLSKDGSIEWIDQGSEGQFDKINSEIGALLERQAKAEELFAQNS